MTQPENGLEREAAEAIDHIVLGSIRAMGAGFRKWSRVMDNVAAAVEQLDAERETLKAELPIARGLRAAAIRARIAQIDAIEEATVARLDAAQPRPQVTQVTSSQAVNANVAPVPRGRGRRITVPVGVNGNGNGRH